jgi:hypothetical protein
VIAAVVLLAVVVTAVVVAAGGDDRKGTVAGRRTGDVAQRAAKAAQRLAGIPALRYSGTFSSGGATMQAQVAVTKAGSASGSIAVDGEKADLVAVDGSTYLKAGRNFWRSHGGVTTNPEDYAGTWSRAPASSLDLDIPGLLSPSAVMRHLRGTGPQGSTAGIDVNGVPAAKATTSVGDFYVSATGEPKFLRMQATGTRPYQFDVSELTAADVDGLFTELRAKVNNLTGALDPGAPFGFPGGLKFSGCGPSGCTVKYTVANESKAPVRAMIKATIRAGGRDLGSCTGSRTLQASGKGDLGCRVTSSGWKSWVRWARSTPGTHRYEAKAQVIGQRPSDVGPLLAKIDQERQGA